MRGPANLPYCIHDTHSLVKCCTDSNFEHGCIRFGASSFPGHFINAAQEQSSTSTASNTVEPSCVADGDHYAPPTSSAERKLPQVQHDTVVQAASGHLQLEAQLKEQMEVNRLKVEQMEEAQRQAIRDAHMREAERQRAEKLELERQESERREQERREAQRRDAEKKEAERREAARKEAEIREAQVMEAKRELERQEEDRQARREAEDRMQAEQEAQRRRAEREAQQEAARQELARLEAVKQEAARQEAARQQEERMRMAELVAKGMEAAKQESERVHAERREAVWRGIKRREEERWQREAERTIQTQAAVHGHPDHGALPEEEDSPQVDQAHQSHLLDAEQRKAAIEAAPEAARAQAVQSAEQQPNGQAQDNAHVKPMERLEDSAEPGPTGATHSTPQERDADSGYVLFASFVASPVLLHVPCRHGSGDLVRCCGSRPLTKTLTTWYPWNLLRHRYGALRWPTFWGHGSWRLSRGSA